MCDAKDLRACVFTVALCGKHKCILWWSVDITYSKKLFKYPIVEMEVVIFNFLMQPAGRGGPGQRHRASPGYQYFLELFNFDIDSFGKPLLQLSFRVQHFHVHYYSFHTILH